MRAWGATMQHYRWNEVEKKQLDALTTRQVIHGETMTIARFDIRKGGAVPEHSHVNEQIATIQSGSVRFIVGGDMVILHAGESLCIPPNVPHSAEALEDSTAVETFSPPRRDWM
jgi:quercetin dioxygenase-like cupin family protein